MAFGVLVAVAGPLLLFHYGEFHWFHRDEWAFLTETGDEWLRYTHEPFSGSHWVAGPRLVFRALWNAFGLTSYRPYQLVIVTLHLSTAVMVHAVMRRSLVRPWLALAAAGVFVIGGPGATTTIWAFQMTIVGSLAFGFAQLLLSDHDGPLDRRDALGLGAGLVAITSSGVGVTMGVAVTASLLLRGRPWRALVHGGPPLLIYATWVVVAGAKTTSEAGRPSIGLVLDWVRSSAVGALTGLGRWTILGWVLGGVVVVGLGLIAARWRAAGPNPMREVAALPLGLFLGAVFFAASTALGRASGGVMFARADRYVYLEVALSLPLVALAAEQIAQRRPHLVPALVVALALPIPANLQGIDAPLFGPDYMAHRRHVLTTAVRMPFAGDVPPEVEPDPDQFSYGVTIGFLLRAQAEGRLDPSDTPLSPDVVNEFRIRLGLSQQYATGPATSCTTYTRSVDLRLAPGTELHLGSPVLVRTQDGQRATSPPVGFTPDIRGATLRVELPDLWVRVGPALGASTFRLCDAADP